MDRSEILFRNGCRQWHIHLEHCAKDGRLDEASQLLKKVAQYLDAWKESLATARAETRDAEKRMVECRRKEASIGLRMRMLGQLFAIMGREFVEKKTQSGGNNE
jgi:hypothetical protein